MIRSSFFAVLITQLLTFSVAAQTSPYAVFRIHQFAIHDQFLEFVMGATRYAERVPGGKLRPQETELRDVFFVSVSISELKNSDTVGLTIKPFVLPNPIKRFISGATLRNTKFDLPEFVEIPFAGKLTESTCSIWRLQAGRQNWHLSHEFPASYFPISEKWNSLGDLLINKNDPRDIRDSQLSHVRNAAVDRVARHFASVSNPTKLQIYYNNDDVAIVALRLPLVDQFDGVRFDGAKEYLFYAGDSEPTKIAPDFDPQKIQKLLTARDGSPCIVFTRGEAEGDFSTIARRLSDGLEREINDDRFAYLISNEGGVGFYSQLPRLSDLVIKENERLKVSFRPAQITYLDHDGMYTFTIDASSCFELRENSLEPVNGVKVPVTKTPEALP